MNELKKLCRFWERLVKIGRKELKREYKLQSFNEYVEEIVNRNEYKKQLEAINITQKEIDEQLLNNYDETNHKYDNQ